MKSPLKGLVVLMVVLSLASCATATFAKTISTQDNTVSRGKAVFIDRERGHCLLCHQVHQISESFQGNLGPDLSNIGSRLGAEELYKRIADPTEQNPSTVMPAYFRTHGLTQVAQDYLDQSVLSAEEMKDLVAFLLTLQLPESQE